MPAPVIIFGNGISMPGHQFESLTVVPAEAEAINWPRHIGKARLGLKPRWHMVERARDYDTPVYFAREITLTFVRADRVLTITPEMRERAGAIVATMERGLGRNLDAAERQRLIAEATVWPRGTIARMVERMRA